MKITLCAACCHDEIVTFDGVVRHSFGGLFYNIAAFSSLCGPDDTVYPLTKLGEDRHAEAVAEMQRFDHLDLSGVQCVRGGKVTDVRLVYTSPGKRNECIRYPMPALQIDDFVPLLDSDAIAINFITATEIQLDTLCALRNRFRGFLAMDIHNLMMYLDDEGRMHRRNLEGWQDWLAPLNLAQMNEVECAYVLGREVVDEIPAYIEASQELLDAVGKSGPPHTPRIAAITLGERGSVIASEQNGSVVAAHCPARKIEKFVDATGCGDSFSAGFTMAYLQTADPILSNAAANIVAGANCEHAGLVSLTHMRNAHRHIADYYPELGSQ